jgi:hypothetical protein
VFDVVFAIFLFVDLDPHSERRIWIQRRMWMQMQCGARQEEPLLVSFFSYPHILAAFFKALISSQRYVPCRYLYVKVNKVITVWRSFAKPLIPVVGGVMRRICHVVLFLCCVILPKCLWCTVPVPSEIFGNHILPVFSISMLSVKFVNSTPP